MSHLKSICTHFYRCWKMDGARNFGRKSFVFFTKNAQKMKFLLFSSTEKKNFVACVPSNNFRFAFFLLRYVSKLFTMWKVFKKCKKTNSKNFLYIVCETLIWRESQTCDQTILEFATRKNTSMTQLDFGDHRQFMKRLPGVFSITEKVFLNKSSSISWRKKSSFNAFWTSLLVSSWA